MKSLGHLVLAAALFLGNSSYAITLNSWLNTNAVPYGSTVRDLKSDGPLGAVLVGNGGVTRFNDDGTMRWNIPFQPATNVATFGNNGAACAVDGLGNTYAAIEIKGTVTIAGMSATNSGTVTANNPSARGTILVKLDASGAGLWLRYIDGGLDYTRLACDGSGGLVISGGHTSVLNFGTASAPADPYAAGVVARYAADGTRSFIRDYPYYSTTGAVEIDAVVAQGTNIWVGGIYNFSLKFGAFNAVNNASGHPYNYWFGCLSTNGAEQWLQTLPSGAQGVQLAVGSDQILWAAGAYLPSTLARFSTNGTTLTYANPITASGGTASMGALSVDTNNQGIISGYFNSTCTIGTNSFTQANTFTNNLYTARFATNGNGMGAVVEGVSTTNGAAFTLFAGNSRGDAYAVGFPVARLGSNSITGSNYFLAKFNAPVLAPFIVTQPNAAYTNLSLSSFQLSVTTVGQAPLSYQWRNNGLPISGGTNATLTFTSPLPADGGSIDCVVTNAYGTVSSIPALVIFRPPFTILQQSSSTEIIFGTNAIAGSNIIANFLQPSALIGHSFNVVITNGTGMWPSNANFVLNFPSTSSYNIPSGTLSNHSGGWALQVATAQATFVSLYYWATSPSNIPSSVSLYAGGAFGIHHDIADPAGCCASGYFSIAPGGSSNVNFSVTTSGSVIPAVQWYRNGVLLAGKTNINLSYIPAGYAQAGTYTATLTYGSYVTNTAPINLNIYPPALGYTFVPANSSFTFDIPPGYLLQGATALAPANWAAITTNNSYTVPAAQPGGYFRIIPQ